MNRLLAMAAALGLVAAPEVAVAGSCRGGSGGGSSGGSHSGGGSGVRVAGAPPCEDTSEVVGLRRCKKFGAWGTNPRIPRVTIEGGVVVRRFASLADGHTGTVLHGSETFSFRVAEVSRSQVLDTAVLSMVRGSVGLSHGLYAALELDLGGLAQPGRAATEMMSTGTFGTPELQQERGLVIDSLGTLGVRGTTRRGGLGVELTGGVRAVSYHFNSSYHLCEHGTTVTAYGPVAEARARGEMWLTPWLTAGVTVGTSVIERSAWMGGIYVGLHTRAFGGDR